MRPFAELRKCVQREVALRHNVYPKLIARGRLTAAQAIVELERMLEVGLVIEALEVAVEHARQEIAKIPIDQEVPKVSLLMETITVYVDARVKEFEEKREQFRNRIVVAKPGEALA